MLNGVTRRLMSATGLALLLVALTSTRVGAHIGGESFILVPSDSVSPGSAFEVIAVDLGPNATISFEVDNGNRVAALGSVPADSDGHFQGALQMPADYPQGYAELIAISSDGYEVATWVLIGPRTASTGAPPGQPTWWSDPSVVVLGVFVVGALGVLGYLLIQRGSTRPAPVRAARRPLPSKRRRARTG